MTHEEFKAVCMKEFPLIEGMVKTVKALGAQRVTCSVCADGFIDFVISEGNTKAYHNAYHIDDSEAGWLQIVEYDENRNAEWMPKCFYDHSIDNDVPDDGVEENLPF
jgi:hypothetical protein